MENILNVLDAVAYVRYSADMQTENSIAYQLEAIKSYCNNNLRFQGFLNVRNLLRDFNLVLK